MTESHLLTLVKPWSTWVITSKTQSTITNDPLNQVNTSLRSNLGQSQGQNSSHTLDPKTLPRTFAAFSNFHLNTSKSANIKVVRLIEGHNFHNWRHWRFGVEDAQKHGQC
jgi:hypothetical protein